MQYDNVGLRISRNCGTLYCNNVYRFILQKIYNKEATVECFFVHISFIGNIGRPERFVAVFTGS